MSTKPYEWGNTLESSFINCAYGMIDYMADRESFDIDHEAEVEFRVSGRDMESLLFNFLDEILCIFVAQPFLAIKDIEILDCSFVDRPYIFGRCHGERFDRDKHKLGTEVKAITYSNMKISQESPFDIYVVVDI